MANTFTMEPTSEDDGSLQLHRSVGPGLGEEDQRNTSQVTWLSNVHYNYMSISLQEYYLIPPITGILPVGELGAGVAIGALLPSLAGVETGWRRKSE